MAQSAVRAIYLFVFLDCVLFKVKVNGAVKTRAIYDILSADIEGKKDVSGLYTAKNEGAKFWLSVLTDVKTRGVEDILIAPLRWTEGFP